MNDTSDINDISDMNDISDINNINDIHDMKLDRICRSNLSHKATRIQKRNWRWLEGQGHKPGKFGTEQADGGISR